MAPIENGGDIPADVAQNYAELHKQGRSWENMAAEAERMGSRDLAAHLRRQDAESKPAGKPSAPQGRSATPPAKQNAEGGKR
jgi:hypothetical protein